MGVGWFIKKNHDGDKNYAQPFDMVVTKIMHNHFDSFKALVKSKNLTNK